MSIYDALFQSRIEDNTKEFEKRFVLHLRDCCSRLPDRSQQPSSAQEDGEPRPTGTRPYPTLYPRVHFIKADVTLRA